MPKKGKRPDQSKSGWGKTIVSILKGGALGAALVLIMLFLSALLVSFGLLPEHAVDRTVLICCVLGSLAGGLLSVYTAGGRAMLAGIGAGGLLFLLLVLGGLVFHGAGQLLRDGVDQAFACFCGGAMAGILGRTPKKRRRR